MLFVIESIRTYVGKLNSWKNSKSRCDGSNVFSGSKKNLWWGSSSSREKFYSFSDTGEASRLYRHWCSVCGVGDGLGSLAIFSGEISETTDTIVDDVDETRNGDFFGFNPIFVPTNTCIAVNSVSFKSCNRVCDSLDMLANICAVSYMEIDESFISIVCNSELSEFQMFNIFCSNKNDEKIG